jgi:nitrile hydratase accessory protein
LPGCADGPVFAEPWQTQAFALTVRLHEAGFFTWTEWAEMLGLVIREARSRGEPDDGARYYNHWLLALERLVIAKQALSASDLDRRKAAWARAYQATSHGQPVLLPDTAN